MRIKMKSVSSAATILVLSSPVNAAIDDNAEIVQLRKSCTVAGETLDNCFTNTATLTQWMADTRKPNANSPLKVNIGPGTFTESKAGGGGQLALWCDPDNGYTGYTTFEGAGSQQTVFNAQWGDPVHVDSCTHLAFSNFGITSHYQYPTWNGGGESRWINMEIRIPGAVWHEQVCGSERGKHYWFSSRLVFGTVDSNRGYHATCDESWFFGTEIRMNGLPSPGVAESAKGFALKATGAGEVHVYGGNIRALGVETSTPVLEAADGGEIHIHGTGIDLVPNPGVNATLMHAGTGGMIHANNAAYSFKYTEGSSITRVSDGGGHIHAPYFWESHPEPPAVVSVTGADTSIVTNTDDGQPHIVIYSDNCPSKWYDTVTKACH